MMRDLRFVLPTNSLSIARLGKIRLIGTGKSTTGCLAQSSKPSITAQVSMAAPQGVRIDLQGESCVGNPDPITFSIVSALAVGRSKTGDTLQRGRNHEVQTKTAHVMFIVVVLRHGESVRSRHNDRGRPGRKTVASHRSGLWIGGVHEC